ncbi:MAG: hypothetical protein IJY08_02450 [Clostridia bacterium]|nr:hypothetical protein [Clostridia bacterium]
MKIYNSPLVEITVITSVDIISSSQNDPAKSDVLWEGVQIDGGFGV